MFDEYNDLISVEELSSILSIGRNAAYALLRNKQIKAFRIGNRWKIPRSSIELYILKRSGLSKK